MFIFLDEWLTYAALYTLWHFKEYTILMYAVPFALFANTYSYYSLWKLQERLGIGF